jgi:hypothetical protein
MTTRRLAAMRERLVSLVEVFVALLDRARLRGGSRYAEISRRLDRLMTRVHRDAERVRDPLRLAIEKELEVLLELVVSTTTVDEREGVIFTLTGEGRHSLAGPLASLERSHAATRRDREVRLRTTNAVALRHLHAFGDRPTLAQARECVLVLEELADRLLTSEITPLEELQRAAEELGSALDRTLTPERLLALAEATDEVMFDELVGAGKPRRLGQYGPKGWRPVYQAILPRRWLMAREAEARGQQDATMNAVEPEAAVEDSGRRDAIARDWSPIDPDDSDPGFPGIYGEEHNEEDAERAREDLGIKIREDSFVQDFPGKRGFNPFWTGPPICPW